MRKLYTYITLCLALAAVSCAKNDVQEEEKGQGTLNMGMSISNMTKAVTAEDTERLLSTATVKIYKSDFSGLVRSYTYSDMSSPFYLFADEYRVDVEAGEAVAENPAPASFTSKSYKGSQTFTIQAGKETNVTVAAGINNAVTNITLDPSIAENFKAGYTFTIGLDPENAATQLVYNASNSGSEGYFIVDGLDEPSLTWTFSGVLAKDDSEFVKTGEIAGVLPGKMYKMTLKYTVKDGDLMLSLVVDYTTDIYNDEIVFIPVSTGLAETPVYEIWAAHTTLYADIDASASEEAASMQFAYSSDGSDWTYVDAVPSGETDKWKADIKNLTPSTEYTYKLIIDGEEIGEARKLTTAAAPALPNGGFECVSKVSGEDYYKFYNPGCTTHPDGSYMFWGSGNGEGKEGVNGSASMGIVITTVDTGDKKEGSQSVLCQNNSIVGMLTAGNLFTGQFAGLVGTSGGKVNFGRPWTSRPTALRIWCKYTTGKFNVMNNKDLGVTTDDFDRAQIKFAIGTWNYKDYGGTKDCPVQINTTVSSTFVDFNTDPSTIANGDLIIYNDGYRINNGSKVSATTAGWIQYTIPLDYRNFTTTPTHIIISCATSQYGDYFTGCDSAKLWIDGAELIYE